MKNLIKKTHFALYILLTLVLMAGCNDSDSESEKVAIPERPLIIIEITSVEQNAGTFAYKYKLVDKNGYVFYQTESAKYNAQPKRMLGDTIEEKLIGWVTPEMLKRAYNDGQVDSGEFNIDNYK